AAHGGPPQAAPAEHLLDHPDQIPLRVIGPDGRDLREPVGVVDHRVEIDDDAVAALAEAEAPVGIVAVNDESGIPEAARLHGVPAVQQGAGGDDIYVAHAASRAFAAW